MLLVLGPNPASAGIHLWAHRLVIEERVEMSLFWEGLRQYWRTAALLFLIDGVEPSLRPAWPHPGPD